MRNAFFGTLHELAEHDAKLTLIVGDLGFSVVEPFAERFPDRFINTGVAEQHMVGLAAGLALSGRTVYVYSIGNFPLLRCLEQVRSDICYHNLPVRIVSVGGGFAYGPLGFSHHATEDLAIARALPNMTVVAPGDPVEVAALTRALHLRPGPCYLRLGRAGDPVVHTNGVPAGEVGRALLIREGEDLTLIATGGILPVVVAAAEILAARGVSARVLSMHTLKPLDVAALTRAASETGVLVTVEEHTAVGGLGSAAAEALLDAGVSTVTLRRLALPSSFATVAGSQGYLREKHGLSADAIARAALEAYRTPRARTPGVARTP